MEKDFLQSLKLEISRTFTLAPYERIAFHKVLGFQKSENGLHILLRDIHKNGLIRRSAVSVLKEWANPEITIAFLDLLVTNDTIASDEFFNIIEHVEKFGKSEHSQPLMEYIGKYLEKTEFVDQTCRAVFALGQIGFEKKEVLDFIRSIITNPAMFERVRCAAIESFIHTADIVTMESVLRENNDRLTYAVYRALAGIADREMIKYEVTAGDDLFTVMPGQDDRVLLDIRVLLGKMSPHFDGYSRETKAAYIMAMILCSHREFIVYTMKALTSNDPALIDLTLYVILSHTDKLRLPDKLFRSLTGLSSVTMRDSEIIIEIFHRFFSGLKGSRNNMLFRDKIYNYLVVTLDTYFEEYRKNYMIPEIMEKNHLPDVQEIRRLVLNRFSPDLKKKIVSYFRNEEATDINKILGAISESVPFISDDENEPFAKFVEMLCEKDKKMREICASRIGDIDYEKRYLKNRIVRICGVIGRLKIDEASANLVKMFNYVKKYFDQDIYSSVTHTLSLLNYPYMLGELEILLVSGDLSDQRRAVRLLPLFSEQRSLNIMLDYMREHCDDDSEIMKEIMMILLRRDVAGNVAAAEISRKIYAENKASEIRRIAILLLGQCSLDADIDFFNEQFHRVSDASIKEAIVQTYDFILMNSSDPDKKKILQFLREYLKDPSIRVRMYSCSILLRLGSQEALVSIREMMIIKNRNIQRDILLVLGNFVTAEIAFFLVSLLKEDYSISSDIIPLFRFLSPEELNEIDHFIVNLFKKYEGYSGDSEGMSKVSTKDAEEIKGYSREEISILMIDVINFDLFFQKDTPVEMTAVFRRSYNRIAEIIAANGGTISRATAGSFIAYFPEVVSTATASSQVTEVICGFNSSLPSEYNIRLMSLVNIDKVDRVNSEIILPGMREFAMLRIASLENRVFLTGSTAQIAEHSFKCDLLPSALFGENGTAVVFRELVSVNNLIVKAENIVSVIDGEEKRKAEERRQIEAGLKNDPQTRKSPNAIVFAAAMEQVGRVLRRDLSDIPKFVAKRSTDREMVKSIERMVDDAYRNYMLQITKASID